MRLETDSHAMRLLTLGIAAALFPIAASVGPVDAAEPERPLPSTQKVFERLGKPAGSQGKFQQLPDNSVFFLPADNPNVPIAVKSKAKIPTAVLGVPLTVKGKQDQGNVAVSGFEFQVLTDWKKNKPNLATARFEPIKKAVAQIEKVQESLSTGKFSIEDKNRFAAQIDATKQAVTVAYRDLGPEDTKARAALVDIYGTLLKTGKAIYRRPDNYRPETYRRILEVSKGSGAIARKSESAAQCSGFLVGRDLVLTANHCFDNLLIDEAEFWFNFEQALDNTYTPVDKYPVKSVVARGSQLPGDPLAQIDYALLRIGANANGKHAHETWPILCLSTARVDRDEPVYVVGHPEGAPRMVHDHAYVYFPFLVTETGYKDLRLLVEAEFKNDKEKDNWIQRFEQSYVASTVGGQRVYRQYSVRWGRQPTISANSDTFHGNSGSPAFSRRHHRVVGILFDGEEDDNNSLRPGWRSHEAILPISEVVADLDKSLSPGWRASNGVCIQ